MTNTLKHLALLARMESSGLKLGLTGKFPEDALDQTCERVETFQLQNRLRTGNDNTQIQKELVRTPEFAALYHALCNDGVDDRSITSMLQSAIACDEQLTQYPKEQVLAAAGTDIPLSLRFYYMKFYLPFIKYEEEGEAIIDNINAFPATEREELSALTDAQKNMMRQPFLGPYLFNWNNNAREELELLEQNQPLQRVLTLLYRQGVALDLNAARLKDLCWVETADVMKFRRLLAAFEYDTEDLNAFFERWLENHAGQYDLNWFISHTPPLDKGQRQEILRNDLSYLNALYSGRLHLDFSAIRRYQFPILTYAVQHGKKHFLDLVSDNSELFLSLGRYALLFEDKFCEHCNLNSLTAKNLQACDTVERGSSHFDLLEDGRQYTFEEMWLLWQQDEIYVRLYAMLTPLSVDRRLLTLRQLLKHGLVSHHMEDQELEQLARCLLEKPFSEWYRGAFGHIRGLTRRTAMWLLRKYEQLQVFIPEMQSEADAIFALNNGAVIAGQKNWTQVRAAVLTMDQDWLDLKQRFSFTDEFVEQHREPVTNFLLRGGSAMVRALYGYLQGDDKAIEALRRIVQAELMGQFYALKYFADDLRREHQLDGGQLRRARRKRAVHHPQAGAYCAAEKFRFGGDHAIRRRRAEINENRGAAVERGDRHRVGDSVAAQLARVLVADVQPRFHAGHEQPRLEMKVIPAHVLDGVIDGRHNGGNHNPLHRLHIQVVITKQIRHDDAILIRCHHRVGRAAPALDQPTPFKHSGFDIGVSNIHCNDHNSIP